MEFTDFDVFALKELDDASGLTRDLGNNNEPCPYDFVQVVDGDGTILMDKSCGYMAVNTSDPNFFSPPRITSKTNMVNVRFSTDGNGVRTGWSFKWEASEEASEGSGDLELGSAGECECALYEIRYNIFVFF